VDFKLNRLILIDSYCRNRIAELDLSGHITINGENGSGKTTLLRLLPMFFGESPSKILRGDAVTEKFGRYYFPTTASYVIFEYLRRGQKALAVIHPEGQSDSVVYRFVDSDYRPELFKDGEGIVQSGALHRHLDKLGVFDSRPLTLHSYKQIIQNTAGREHKNLAGRFAFTGGTGKLQHIERVVTGILQRATTFYDLKRMIVSSILEEDEGFSLQTGKKDMLHWVSEYESHHALMEKIPVMSALEQSDQYRRLAEIEFAKLHARFKLLHDFFEQQLIDAEAAELAAKDDKTKTEKDYDARLQTLNDSKNDAVSKAKISKDFVDQLDRRRQYFTVENAEGKGAKVDALPGWKDELDVLVKQLEDLEKEVKSQTEIFDGMEREARSVAQAAKAKQTEARGDVFQLGAKQKSALIDLHRENASAIRARQEPEFERVSTVVSDLRVKEAGLVAEVRNALPDLGLQEALDMDRQVQSDASAALDKLHDATDGLRRGLQKVKTVFEETELQITGGEVAVENIEDELEKLLAADSAGEDTLLGFLRRHKPDWSGSIGKLVSEETLLNRDLSPAMGEGDNLYGIGIDLSKLRSGRFATEEILQQEIKLARARLDKRRAEVVEDKKILLKKRGEFDKAKGLLDVHDLAIAAARLAKLTADQRVQSANQKVVASKRTATLRAEEALKACRTQLLAANEAIETTKIAHRAELSQAELAHSQALGLLLAEETAKLAAIDSQKKEIDQALEQKLAQVAQNRDECLRSNGISPDTLNGIRSLITQKATNIQAAEDLRGFVAQYRDWLENVWPQRAAKLQEFQTHDATVQTTKRQIEALLLERFDVYAQKQKAIDEAGALAEKNDAYRHSAQRQMRELATWPIDAAVLEAGHDQSIGLDALGAERKRLQETLEDHRERIRVGVEDIRKQMGAIVGTGPEKFLANALRERDCPRPGREHEWIEVFRNWFGNEHAMHRTSLLQIGKMRAEDISHFWKSLGDFKQNVATFGTELAANLVQGRIFDTIADVQIELKTHVDTQDYWESVETLHHEYDAWHTQGDASLPPPSFVAAIKKVAAVLSDEKGLVADPVDLISMKISANVNDQGSKTASNEHELANMSSNGLSYIILCVILIGFVNRIRRKENVVIPFVVDELRDLSFQNAQTLINLLTRNNITIISAFPDVDLDLAELFARNYKIMPGRKIGLIDLEYEQDEVRYA